MKRAHLLRLEAILSAVEAEWGVGGEARRRKGGVFIIHYSFLQQFANSGEKNVIISPFPYYRNGAAVRNARQADPSPSSNF